MNIVRWCAVEYEGVRWTVRMYGSECGCKVECEDIRGSVKWCTLECGGVLWSVRVYSDIFEA